MYHRGGFTDAAPASIESVVLSTETFPGMRKAGARIGQCLFCAFRARSQLPRSLTTQFSTSYSAKALSYEQSDANDPLPSHGRKSFDVGFKDSPVHSAPIKSLNLRRARQKGKGRHLSGPQLFNQRQVRQRQFKPAILKRLELLSKWAADPKFRTEVGLVDESVDTRIEEFKSKIQHILEQPTKKSSDEPHPIQDALRAAYVAQGDDGIDAQLKLALQGHIANYAFTTSDLINQAKLADLRYPHEWYPSTRKIQRTIHLHVGPTNSGKTYHALKRLEQASSGLYAGPLRLLAHEVFTRLNALGKTCGLITGDERIFHDRKEQAEPSMISCTVEMATINRPMEVAVVDEIQMIGNEQRGWAWTQAVLSIQAEELHLCGEERAVPIIKEIAAATGDKLHVHRYERLSPLRTMSASLGGKLKSLRKGDCVVVFSRMGIHSLKKDIEKATQKRVAVVYGSLPPETRTQQARLFNDPDNDYDILVASDAIGMGLNLSIKRIIFESTSRHNGSEFQTLSVSDIKQIAGRAGRYRTASDIQESTGRAQSEQDATNEFPSPSIKSSPSKNLGLVTSLENIDLPVIQRAMATDAVPIQTAGIFPPDSLLLKFATYFPPQTPFSYILLRLHEISTMHPRYHLCSLKEHVGTADLIQQIQNLTTADRITLCAAPVDYRDPYGRKMIMVFARCVADQINGGLLDIPELRLEVLDAPMTTNMSYLRELEGLHKSLVLYLWLSYRFNGVFTSPAMAAHAKTLVEEKIDKALAMFSSDDRVKKRIKKAREKAILQSFQDLLESEEDDSETQASKGPDTNNLINKDSTSRMDPNPEDSPRENGSTFQSSIGELQSTITDMGNGAAEHTGSHRAPHSPDLPILSHVIQSTSLLTEREYLNTDGNSTRNYTSAVKGPVLHRTSNHNEEGAEKRQIAAST